MGAQGERGDAGQQGERRERGQQAAPGPQGPQGTPRATRPSGPCGHLSLFEQYISTLPLASTHNFPDVWPTNHIRIIVQIDKDDFISDYAVRPQVGNDRSLPPPLTCIGFPLAREQLSVFSDLKTLTERRCGFDRTGREVHGFDFVCPVFIHC
jgi:hypothetical protein